MHEHRGARGGDATPIGRCDVRCAPGTHMPRHAAPHVAWAHPPMPGPWGHARDGEDRVPTPSCRWRTALLHGPGRDDTNG